MTTRTELENGLIRMLEKCKRGDVGDLPIEVPSLISFTLDPMQIQYDGFTTDLSELTVEGLEHLTLERLSASESELTVSLAFNASYLIVRADRYNLRGQAFIFGINDVGSFRADVRNFRATAVVKFAAAGSNVVIEKLDIDYSLGQVQAHLSGSPFLVTGGFNTSLYKLLTTDKGLVIAKAKIVIERAVNQILRGFSPAMLIEVVSQI